MGEPGIIVDGSLLIRDGIIEEVGPTRRVENLASARGAVEINAVGRVVMPGFIDSHTHLVFPLAGAGTDDEAMAARAVCASTGQRIQWRTQVHLAAMARHGTTTVEAKTGCGPDERAETKLLRVLASLKDNPLHVVSTFLCRLPHRDLNGYGGPEEAAEYVIERLLPKIRRRRFARFADLAWEAGNERVDIYRRYLRAAHSFGFASKVHADQVNTATAIATAVEQLAVSVDHLEHAMPREAELLAGSGTMATLLPLTSLHNGGWNAPARALIDAGVPVALASDFNPHHSPTLSMQTVVALACMNLGMTPEEAIAAATINGAHALGRADRVGSLELGKRADLLILNSCDFRELAHQFGMNLVHMTIRDGECIYKEGDVAPRPAEDIRPGESWD